MPNELGDIIKNNYRYYFLEVIEKSEEYWMETLFPNSELTYYCGFKKMYIGIVGRLLFFSNNGIKNVIFMEIQWIGQFY